MCWTLSGPRLVSRAAVPSLVESLTGNDLASQWPKEDWWKTEMSDVYVLCAIDSVGGSLSRGERVYLLELVVGREAARRPSL